MNGFLYSCVYSAHNRSPLPLQLAFAPLKPPDPDVSSTYPPVSRRTFVSMGVLVLTPLKAFFVSAPVVSQVQAAGLQIIVLVFRVKMVCFINFLVYININIFTFQLNSRYYKRFPTACIEPILPSCQPRYKLNTLYTHCALLHIWRSVLIAICKADFVDKFTAQ